MKAKKVHSGGAVLGREVTVGKGEQTRKPQLRGETDAEAVRQQRRLLQGVHRREASPQTGPGGATGDGIPGRPERTPVLLSAVVAAMTCSFPK